MEALVCLAFPLSLKVHVDLQCLSMYYHRDPPDDPHHPVDPIPEKRLADQQVPLCGVIGTVIKLLASDPICFGCFPLRGRIAKQMVLSPEGRNASN